MSLEKSFTLWLFFLDRFLTIRMPGHSEPNTGQHSVLRRSPGEMLKLALSKIENDVFVISYLVISTSGEILLIRGGPVLIESDFSQVTDDVFL